MMLLLLLKSTRDDDASRAYLELLEEGGEGGRDAGVKLD